MIKETKRTNDPQSWFTADLHLGHTNIMRFCERPFETIGEHDAKLIQNINDRVQPNDIFYVVGDFSFRGSGSIKEYRDRIACKNVVLIMGNHDLHRRNGVPDNILLDSFQTIRDLMKVRVKIFGIRQEIILCHYALRTWNKSHHGTWQLYGHSHGQLPDDPNSLSFDAGVDCHNFCPLNLMDITAIMSKKTFTAVHHNKHYELTAHEEIMKRWRQDAAK